MKSPESACSPPTRAATGEAMRRSRCPDPTMMWPFSSRSRNSASIPCGAMSKSAPSNMSAFQSSTTSVCGVMKLVRQLAREAQAERPCRGPPRPRPTRGRGTGEADLTVAFCEQISRTRTGHVDGTERERLIEQPDVVSPMSRPSHESTSRPSTPRPDVNVRKNASSCSLSDHAVIHHVPTLVEHQDVPRPARSNRRDVRREDPLERGLGIGAGEGSSCPGC